PVLTQNLAEQGHCRAASRVTERDAGIPRELDPRHALERRAAYVASVAGRRQVEQRLELRLLPELGRLELRICRQDALAAVVGAGRLAVVAAEDPRADAAPQLARHRARMLDRQVRDTAPRIDAMRSVERGRR